MRQDRASDEREADVTNLVESAHKVRRIARTGEALGLVAMLPASTGLFRLRVQHEVLPPGRRVSPPHAHTTREEVFFVLAGTPHLWLGGRIVELRPGDCVAVPAGTGQAHTLINDGRQDVELLAIASQGDGDRCYYPLNPTPGDVPPDVLQAWRARPLGPHGERPTGARAEADRAEEARTRRSKA
jgi:uncharacterized cupin superfamily protein